MSHDPKVYSDPFAFKPERFLGAIPEQDPRVYGFGFGRRCVVHLYAIFERFLIAVR